jgi:hypothetical protein
MAFFPHFGILGGSAEWEPQSRPEGQRSIGELNRFFAPNEFDEILRQGRDPNPDVSNPGKLPRAEEFQPHRPLTMAEIVEMQQPGGRERVEAQMRMERGAEEDIIRQLRHNRIQEQFALRQMEQNRGGADLPLPPGGSFQRPAPDMGGLPQMAPLPPRRPPGLGGY